MSNKLFKHIAVLVSISLLHISLYAQRGVPFEIRRPEDNIPFPTYFYFAAVVGLIIIAATKKDDEEKPSCLRIVGFVLCVPVALKLLSFILGTVLGIFRES